MRYDVSCGGQGAESREQRAGSREQGAGSRELSAFVPIRRCPGMARNSVKFNKF